MPSCPLEIFYTEGIWALFFTWLSLLESLQYTGIPLCIVLRFIALHRCCGFFFFLIYWRQDLPPIKRLWLAVLRYLLHSGDLELNLQYLWGMPVHSFFPFLQKSYLKNASLFETKTKRVMIAFSWFRRIAPFLTGKGSAVLILVVTEVWWSWC